MSEKTFSIDRPVEGEIYKSSRNKAEQIDGPEFIERLDAVLDLPFVRGVIWDQYTPYFNDGDELIFSVQEPRILFEFDTEDGVSEDSRLFTRDDAYREYSTGYSADDLFLGNEPSKYDYWVGSWPNRTLDDTKVSFIADGQDGLDLRPYYDALKGLSTTAEWEEVALTNFGDHAEVTATKDGFSVETYEHD